MNIRTIFDDVKEVLNANPPLDADDLAVFVDPDSDRCDWCGGLLPAKNDTDAPKIFCSEECYLSWGGEERI